MENPLGKENIPQSDPCQPQITQTMTRAQSRLQNRSPLLLRSNRDTIRPSPQARPNDLGTPETGPNRGLGQINVN